MANALDILSTLLQKNADPNSAQSGIGPATTNQLNKIGATASDATGPYQEGVAKALKKLGEQHAVEAVQSGVSPQDIQNHSIMQQSAGQSGMSTSAQPGNETSGQIQPEHIAALASILSAVQQKSNNNTQQEPLQQNNNIPNVQGSGILSKFLGMDLQPDITSQRLSNIQTLQKITGQEPIQPAQKPVLDMYAAQTKELNQKIAGAEPIQPKDIADLNRQTYSATIQAANDAWQRNTEEIKTAQEQYKALQENRGAIGKGLGSTTSDMEKLQKFIIAKMQQNQQHLSNIQMILKNPPKAVNEQPSNVNNSPFQIGQQYNGETIKNVKRVK